jgi:hypothetical protein
MAGNYPRIPGITLGFGLVHYLLLPATHQLTLLVQSGWSAPPFRLTRSGATNNMSQFQWHHTRQRRILLRRPAGLLFTVDDPMRRSHHPRAFAPSYQQRYEVKIDGPIQFAFANPLCLPTPDRWIAVIQRARLFAGFPPCSRPRIGHPDEKRFGRGCGPRTTMTPSAS